MRTSRGCAQSGEHRVGTRESGCAHSRSHWPCSRWSSSVSPSFDSLVAPAAAASGSLPLELAATVAVAAAAAAESDECGAPTVATSVGDVLTSFQRPLLCARTKLAGSSSSDSSISSGPRSSGRPAMRPNEARRWPCTPGVHRRRWRLNLGEDPRRKRTHCRPPMAKLALVHTDLVFHNLVQAPIGPEPFRKTGPGLVLGPPICPVRG